MKCGSTAFYDWITLHPQAVKNSNKAMGETHYFSIHIEKKSIYWYAKKFPNMTTINHQNRFTLEKSPSYITTPSAPINMRQIIPQARLVMTLRDPVERFFSHYYFWLPKNVHNVSSRSPAAWGTRDMQRLSRCNARQKDGTFDWSKILQCYPDQPTFTAEGYVVRGLYVYQIQHWYQQ